MIHDLTERLALMTERLTCRINYERQPTGSVDALGLDGIRDLLKRLGDPQLGYPVVHIAGTKGKGSVTRLVAAILNAAGYRAGSYTSPHLRRLAERFEIHNAPVADHELLEALEIVWPEVEASDQRETARLTSSRLNSRREDTGSPLEPAWEPNGSRRLTYFDICTALAWVVFSRHQVDAAAVEVGLGGRLDSTNVCEPAVTVITSISLDHTRQLGETTAAIALEKAGIIKPAIPVVCGPLPNDAEHVIRAVARQRGAALYQFGRDFRAYESSLESDGVRFSLSGTLGDVRFDLPGLFLPLLGRHQIENASLAVAAAALLEQHRLQGLLTNAARALAEFAHRGRIEVIRQRPTVVMDVAHNVASAQALIATLDDQVATWKTAGKRWLILAISRDKDHLGIVRVLAPHFDEILVTRFAVNPRARPTDSLRAAVEQALAEVECRESDGPDRAKRRNPRVQEFESLAGAWQMLREAVSQTDFVCVTGSLFLVGELAGLLENAGDATITDSQ